MIALEWPLLLLAAPAPWFVARALPPAPPPPRCGLRVPFFADLADGSGPAETAAAPRGRLLGLIAWAGLILAAARPEWNGVALYPWPLAVALGAAALGGLRVASPAWPQPRTFGPRRSPPA